MRIWVSAIEVIRSVAAPFITISFLAQAIYTMKTKGVSGNLLTMYTLFALGVLTCLVYVFLIGSLAMIFQMYGL